MKRYIMFLDWKNQYGKNDYTNQSNLQIQWNPYQITKGIFHRTRQKPLQFAWKHKRPQTVKKILRKKKGKLEKSIFLERLQVSDFTLLHVGSFGWKFG